MAATQLIADLAKKSGLAWVSYNGKSRAMWHEWVDDAVCVVTGGTEQALAGIVEQNQVTLILRSKATRALVAETVARVEVVQPHSENWDAITAVLKAGRLNLRDSSNAVDRWARESVVLRLVPIGPVRVPTDLSAEIGHTAPRLAY